MNWDILSILQLDVFQITGSLQFLSEQISICYTMNAEDEIWFGAKEITLDEIDFVSLLPANHDLPITYVGFE